jgi:hypothetical protein
LSLAAQADGANSLQTQLRARGIYGSRIYALQARGGYCERERERERERESATLVII